MTSSIETPPKCFHLSTLSADEWGDLVAALGDAREARHVTAAGYENRSDYEAAALDHARARRYAALTTKLREGMQDGSFPNQRLARSADDIRRAIYALLCGIVACTQQAPSEKRKNLATDVPTMSHAMRQIEALQWVLGDLTEGAAKFNKLIEECRDVVDLPTAIKDIKRELPGWARQNLFDVVPY